MSWIAAIAELLAKWLVGNKNKWGHIVHLISGFLWTYIAFKIELYALLIITVPSILINCRNFYKWWNEESI